MAHTPSSEIVRVMIVDDHEIVRRGIAEIIDRADGLDVVAEAGSRAEAVRRAELVRPDVILVDLQLPDGTGIELMQELRDSVPQALPIVLTSFDDDEALAEALAAGARAYLLKTVHVHDRHRSGVVARQAALAGAQGNGHHGQRCEAAGPGQHGAVDPLAGGRRRGCRRSR